MIRSQVLVVIYDDESEAKRAPDVDISVRVRRRGQELQVCDVERVGGPLSGSFDVDVKDLSKPTPRGRKAPRLGEGG